MSRTRSGRLDRFDLTGISDSEDDSIEDSDWVHHEQFKRTNHHGESTATTPAATATATATASITPTSNRKTSPPTKSGGSNHREGIPPVYRVILPSVSPLTSNEKLTVEKRQDYDCAIEIVGESNPGSNPFIDFPHRREDCQRFGFVTHQEQFCRLCYCYICDIPASECSEWKAHCPASHSDAKSRLQRKSVQIRKNTLRPRNHLRPPHRMRQYGESAAAGKNQVSTKPVTSRVDQPSPLVPLSNAFARKKIPKNSKTKPTLVSSASMLKSLRPRTGIQLPTRLRASAGMLSVSTSKQHKNQTPTTMPTKGTAKKQRMEAQNAPLPSRVASKQIEQQATLPSRVTNKRIEENTTLTLMDAKGKKRKSPSRVTRKPQLSQQKTKEPASTSERMDQKRTVPFGSAIGGPVSLPSLLNLQHDLFLPGKKTTEIPIETQLPIGAVNIASATKPQDQRKRAHWRRKAIESQPKTKRSLTSGKRKRSQNSALHDPEPQKRNKLVIHSTHGIRTPPKPKKSGSSTRKPMTPRKLSASGHCSPPMIGQIESKSFSYFTRSHGQATGTTASEISHGTLGAYWRGEPTKYAGVPYQKRTENAGSKRVPAEENSSHVSRNKTRRRVFSSRRNGGALAPSLRDASVKTEFIATLEGTISYDAESQKYSILGTWHCPWSKSYPPQKFGLLRALRKGEKGPTARGFSLDGSFDGYCVVLTESLDAKGKASYHDRLVFENGVLFEFKSSHTRSDSTKKSPLEVHGSGSNKFGAFLIHGKAQPCRDQKPRENNNLYTFVLQKRYLPDIHDTNEINSSVPNKREFRSTRSNAIYSNGTIVRKLFQNGEYHEGEVMRYDAIHKHYRIKFIDGGLENFDEADMKKYYKYHQKYSHSRYAKNH